jgi:hypothetical protein
MAITHSTAMRTVLADAVDTAINTGAGTATLVIKDGAAALATINLQNPAFGAASSGVITLAGVPLSDASADATGTADSFDIEDRDGTVVISGTVTASAGGGDIELDNTSINITQSVEITSLTYTAPA